MTKTMMAMQLHAFGGVENFRWDEVPLPEPGPNQVRVRIRAVSLNPVDWKMRQGRLYGDVPVVLGRDVAGEIDALGEGVKEWAVGDRVVGVLFGPRSNGAYAQYVVSDAAFIAPLPNNATFEQGASLGVAGLTAYEAVVLKAKVQPGEAVFVAGGAGGVGSFAIPLLRMIGADPILTTAGSDESASFLTEHLGIDPAQILRYPDHDAESQAAWVRERGSEDGSGIPVAFDLVGGEMKRLCFNVIGFYGRVTSIVEEYDPDFAIDIWRPTESPLYARTGSYHYVAVSAPARFGGSRHWGVYRKMFDALTVWINAGRLPWPPITVLGELSEDVLGEAHTRMETGHVRGKWVLTVP